MKTQNDPEEADDLATLEVLDEVRVESLMIDISVYLNNKQ